MASCVLPGPLYTATGPRWLPTRYRPWLPQLVFPVRRCRRDSPGQLPQLHIGRIQEVHQQRGRYRQGTVPYPGNLRRADLQRLGQFTIGPRAQYPTGPVQQGIRIDRCQDGWQVARHGGSGRRRPLIVSNAPEDVGGVNTDTKGHWLTQRDTHSVHLMFSHSAAMHTCCRLGRAAIEWRSQVSPRGLSTAGLPGPRKYVRTSAKRK